MSQNKGNASLGCFPTHWAIACCFCFENRNGCLHAHTHTFQQVSALEKMLFSAGFIIKHIFVEKY